MGIEFGSAHCVVRILDLSPGGYWVLCGSSFEFESGWVLDLFRKKL